MPRSYVVQQIILRFRIRVTIFAAIQSTMNQHCMTFQISNRLHFNVANSTAQKDVLSPLCVRL